MRIGYRGELKQERRVRAAFVGCGSHAFRNLYPCLPFVPVELVATCDLQIDKARAFARAFGAPAAYDDHRQMLAAEKPEAVFLCLGYDRQGRPLYPPVATDCLQAGCHVWMEKPPAATCAEIVALQAAAARAGRHVMVGLKKMFAPANVKARALMDAPAFGRAQVATVRYPVAIPTAAEFDAYLVHSVPDPAAVSFLDHLCHPVSLLLLLLGMPQRLHYRRAPSGAGVATFGYVGGAVASLVLSQGQSHNGGLENTLILGDGGQHIVVENNTRVTLYRLPPVPYGESPAFYVGDADSAAAMWEPEFSLGQLYNKGLFLLGYHAEFEEFCRAILDDRAPRKGTLDHAWQVTRLFEAFAEGPEREISIASADGQAGPFDAAKGKG